MIGGASLICLVISSFGDILVSSKKITTKVEGNDSGSAGMRVNIYILCQCVCVCVCQCVTDTGKPARSYEELWDGPVMRSQDCRSVTGRVIYFPNACSKWWVMNIWILKSETRISYNLTWKMPLVLPLWRFITRSATQIPLIPLRISGLHSNLGPEPRRQPASLYLNSVIMKRLVCNNVITLLWILSNCRQPECPCVRWNRERNIEGTSWVLYLVYRCYSRNTTNDK